MADLEQRVVALEQFVASLKAAIGGTQHRTAHAGAASGGEVASDDLMSREWADMTIAKCPPRWNGEDFSGRKMSECSVEFLESYAGFYEWKGNKGKTEDPPRLDNKNRPWFERDFLIAKLARGWAQRARQGAAAKVGAAKPVARPKFDEPEDDLDGLPF